MIMRNFVHILAVVAVVAASPAAAFAEEPPPSDTAPAPPPPVSPPPVLTAPHLDDKPPASRDPKHTVIPPGHTVPDEPFTHDESPYALRLDLDIATLALGTVLWAGTSFVGPTGGAFCGTSTTAPCDPSQINAFDRLAIGHSNQNARTAATVIEFVPIIYLGLDMFDVGLKNWKTYLTDLWVVAEALAWNGAVQDIVRRAVRRPRPFLYTAGVYPSERDGSDAGFSFYSGHTSFAFALATSCSYTFTLRHPHSKWKWVVWPALMAVASIEPVLRVYSGDHFPTDVIVGALAGSAIGVLFPALHRRLRSGPKVVTGMRIVPIVAPEQTVLALVGRF
jgi:membrane-associated phospholipid phosphatase